jgi:hypothetical protein
MSVSLKNGEIKSLMSPITFKKPKRNDPYLFLGMLFIPKTTL